MDTIFKEAPVNALGVGIPHTADEKAIYYQMINDGSTTKQARIAINKMACERHEAMQRQAADITYGARSYIVPTVEGDSAYSPDIPLTE